LVPDAQALVAGSGLGCLQSNEESFLSRVPFNTLLQLFSRGLELVSGLLVNAWLARHWGSTAFGQVGFYTSLATVAACLFDLGLGTLLIRSIAREPARVRPYVASALRALPALALLGTAVVVAVGQANMGAAATPVLLLVALQLVLTAAMQVLRAAFYAYERMEYESGTIALERTIWIAAGLWLALAAPDPVALFAAMAGAKAAGVALGAWLFQRHVRPERPDERPVALRALLAEAWPFGFNLGLTTLAASADVVLLSFVAPEAEVGLYRAAGLVIMPLTLGAIAVNNALFPRMCAHREGLEAAGHQAARLALVAALPLAAFVACYAPALTQLVFGAKYAAAAPLLAILAAVVPLRFLHNTLGTTLSAGDRQPARMRCAAVAAAVSVALNLVFLPVLGATGACLTAIASDMAMVWALHRTLAARAGLAGLLLAGGGLSAALVAPLAYFAVPWWAAAALVAIAYPPLLWLTRAYHPRELLALVEERTPPDASRYA
jgi:O-antigen/teichoic acid export membrane protein